jgi:hypothetical protein
MGQVDTSWWSGEECAVFARGVLCADRWALGVLALWLVGLLVWVLWRSVVRSANPPRPERRRVDPH